MAVAQKHVLQNGILGQRNQRPYGCGFLFGILLVYIYIYYVIDVFSDYILRLALALDFLSHAERKYLTRQARSLGELDKTEVAF